jgi:S-adenosylmethionine:tRNA ribosyltransferase-isomerase
VRPASRAADRREGVGLLVVDESGAVTLDRFESLPRHLGPGDVVVVNDAATFPGSLSLRTAAGEPIELRLIEERAGRFFSLAFGAGDWRTDTLERPAPPPLSPGDPLFADGERVAEIVAIDPRSPRLVEVRLGPGDLHDPWSVIYRLGRPIQYSYLESDLELWSVQTAYASRPIAAEMPSAGRPLSWSIIAALRGRGVEVVALTHAAGISSTGDRQLDALLPFPERYHIRASTAAAVNRARGRVVAVGTTVVRALESAARILPGSVVPGPGLATLTIDAATELRAVDAIVTGLHDAGASHWRLLEAFADPDDLDAAWTRAAAAGFRAHELGDVALIAAAPQRRASRARPHHRAKAALASSSHLSL